MTAHSKLGASSMSRWSKCPGSVREAAKAPPGKSSSYAEEGSDAHALAARCLRKVANPGSFIGKTITEDGRTFLVDKEMADAVQVYVDAVDAVVDESVVSVGLKAEVLIEKRFDLSGVHAGCFGTADAIAWRPQEHTLHVFDYKHGAGIPVEVKGNPQLMYYGLGALLASGYPARKVVLTIVQPRCDHPDGPVRSDELDAIDLLDFKTDLKSYAVATEAPDAPLVPGDHCRFCPAMEIDPETMDVRCGAVRKRRQEVTRLEFAPTLSYSPEKLKLALDSRETLKAWLKALDEFAYAEAEAGRTPTGYKLVAKRANRKWRDEGELAAYLQGAYTASVMREVYEPPTLKSPAQMEKVPGILKGTLDKYAIAESSGHVLVPDSDKRPAVRLDAKTEFTAIAN